jgi:EmrB/QacA subfamily drug resistance transporter
VDEAARKRVILILCCVAQFMVILDVSVVNIALPTISKDLHFSPTGLEWIINAYTLAFGGFLLLGGRAADLIGRRTMFVAGLTLFSAASFVGGLSTSSGMLIAARAAQGLGGAIVAPATLSVLSATFTAGAERNRAMGAWGSMGGIGGVTGAIGGGVITQYLGWEWTLFINVPIGAACALVAARVLEHDERPEERRNFDALGAVVITTGLTALTYGIISTHDNGWGSVQTLVALLGGAALITAFVLIERFVATRPLVDFSIFRSRPVVGSNLVVFTLGAGAFAMWYLVSLYLQHVRLYDPVDAGLAILPGALGIVGGSLLAARLTTRFGGGWVMTGGMTLLAAGLLWMSNASPGGSLFLELMVPLIVVTFGIGLTFVPTTIIAMAGVKPQQAGLASGVLNTSRQFGGTLSIAVLVTIAASRTAALTPFGQPTRAALNAGYMHALAIGAVFAAVGAIAGFLLVARERTETPVLRRAAPSADIHS